MRRSLSLVAFFAGLALKESVFPGLTVRPRVAELFLTENCNLRCISCTCWHEHKQGELTTEQWFDILSQLSQLRFLKINFTGGEPLIRKDFFSILARAHALGFAIIHLNTNGYSLSAETIDRLLLLGVRSFNVSLDGGSAAVHNIIRGRSNAFEQTTRNIQTLVEKTHAMACKVRVNFTVMRSNIGDLPNIADYVIASKLRLYLNLASDKTFLFRDPRVTREMDIDRGAMQAALKALAAKARRHPRYLPTISEIKYIPRHFSSTVQRQLPCAESQLKLMIHADGRLGGCWGHDPAFDIRSMPIAEVLRSTEYRQQQARFFQKDCVGCGSNYALNLRWRPGTVVRNALWRLAAWRE